jgi:hypothetical protein
MPPTLEMNLTVMEQNLDSMHQEAKHVLSKLIESCHRESELRQENEGSRQRSTGLQVRLDQAEKDKGSVVLDKPYRDKSWHTPKKFSVAFFFFIIVQI